MEQSRSRSSSHSYSPSRKPIPSLPPPPQQQQQQQGQEHKVATSSQLQILNTPPRNKLPASRIQPFNTPTNTTYRNYALLIEFATLQHAKLTGLWVMPNWGDVTVWNGVIFPRAGPYISAVFKFQLIIPKEYPSKVPEVKFLTDLFHPLINSSGSVQLADFTPPEEGKEHIQALLEYLRLLFSTKYLNTVSETLAINRDAWKMYTLDRATFNTLAQQASHFSNNDSILYDNTGEFNSIKFSKMSDSNYEQIRKEILATVEPNSSRQKLQS